MDVYITVPAKKEDICDLKAGDMVYMTGELITARDAAHKRIYDELTSGGKSPVSMENKALYYMGPTPAREGRAIGSAGPTTSSRMDKYTPAMLDLGVNIMIGKGKRSPKVAESITEHGAVYMAAIGGAGALLSKCIKSSEVIAYDDLGTEAIRRLEVKDFPAIVVIDSRGNNLYETAPEKYRIEEESV